MRVFIPVSEKDSEKLVRNSTTIGEIVRRLIGNPRSELLQKWNWKSASLSSFSRALIFFGANLGAGTRAAIGAMTLEFAYRAITSGFYGAITQSFRKAQPVWAATLTVMLCVPAVTHSIEFAVHSIGGTQRLATSMGASGLFLGSIYRF
jgi:hypothetical protein